MHQLPCVQHSTCLCPRVHSSFTTLRRSYCPKRKIIITSCCFDFQIALRAWRVCICQSWECILNISRQSEISKISSETLEHGSNVPLSPQVVPTAELLSSLVVSLPQTQAQRTSISFWAQGRFHLRLYYVILHCTSHAHTVLELLVQGKFGKETVQNEALNFT